MAGSIGELFVSLGFDVDDTKLKDFQAGLKGVASTMLELAGITVSIGGFTALLNGAADTATELQNLSVQLGVNQRSAQGWAAAMHEANPLVSYEQGLQSVKHLAEYINAMQTGRGGNEAGMFGVTGADNTPEKVIARVRENWARVVGVNGIARATEWATAIFGTAGAVNALAESEEELQKGMAKGIISQQDTDNLARYNKAIADLSINFNQLKASWLSVPAEKIADFLKGANEGTLTYNDSWWGKTVSAVDKGLTNTGHALWEGILTVADPTANADIIHQIAWGDGTQRKSAPASSSNAKDAPSVALSYFQSKGWSPEQAAGIVDNLERESSLIPNHYGHGDEAKGAPKEAYGLAQWHRDRIAALEAAGFNPRGSSEEQMEAINYELTRGMFKQVGAALKTRKSETDSEKLVRNDYEIPAGSVHINVTNQLPAGASPTEYGAATANAIKQTFAQQGWGASR